MRRGGAFPPSTRSFTMDCTSNAILAYVFYDVRISWISTLIEYDVSEDDVNVVVYRLLQAKKKHRQGSIDGGRLSDPLLLAMAVAVG